jgi:hypothetical protein
MAGSAEKVADIAGGRTLWAGRSGTGIGNYGTYSGGGNDYNQLGAPDYLNYSVNSTAIGNTAWSTPSFYAQTNGAFAGINYFVNEPTISEIEFAIKANMTAGQTPWVNHLYFFRLRVLAFERNRSSPYSYTGRYVYSSADGNGHYDPVYPDNADFYPGASNPPTWWTNTSANIGPIGIYPPAHPYVFDNRSPAQNNSQGSAGTGGNDNDYRASAKMPYLIMALNPLTVSYAQQLSVSAKNSTVALAWATATETNNKQFVVERSSDGQTFAQIGIVPSKAANGNSTAALSYTFTDNNPLSGINYYRLQQVDISGNATNSIIASATVGKVSVSLYPNPATSSITVQNVPIGSSVAIYNTAGNTVYTGTVTASRFNINVQHFSAGIYFLQYNANGVKNSITFIKH